MTLILSLLLASGALAVLSAACWLAARRQREAARRQRASDAIGALALRLARVETELEALRTGAARLTGDPAARPQLRLVPGGRDTVPSP